MHITANIKTADGSEIRVDFAPGEAIAAADTVNTFLARLAAGVPSPVAAIAPPPSPAPVIDVTPEQKEESGTPRRARPRKLADLVPAIPPLDPEAVDHEAEMALITAMDPSPIIGDTSHLVAAAAAETPTEAPAAPAEEPGTIAEAAEALYAARGYDGAGQVAAPEAAPEAVAEPPAASTASPYITEAQQQEVRDLFAAAGFTPLKTHTFLTTEYPGVPVTIDTLNADQFAGLVPILRGKVRDAEQKAGEMQKAAEQAPPPPPFDDVPPPEAPVMPLEEGEGFGEEDRPAGDADPLVTPEEAAEVRQKAADLKIPPGDARRILKKHFDVGSPDELRRSQARKVIDLYFPAEVEEMDGVPF